MCPTLCLSLANNMEALWNLQRGFLGSAAMALFRVTKAFSDFCWACWTWNSEKCFWCTVNVIKLFLFKNKMLVISAGIHKMLVEIAYWVNSDQTASDLCLPIFCMLFNFEASQYFNHPRLLLRSITILKPSPTFIAKHHNTLTIPGYYCEASQYFNHPRLLLRSITML